MWCFSYEEGKEFNYNKIELENGEEIGQIGEEKKGKRRNMSGRDEIKKLRKNTSRNKNNIKINI